MERHLGLLFANMRNTPGQAFLMPCLGMYAIVLTRKRAAGRASSGDRLRLAAITRLLERRARANPGDHRPFLDLIAAERIQNLKAVAKAKGESVRDVTAVILDRPRHEELIAEVRAAGARIRLIPDGDVAGPSRRAGPTPGPTSCSASAARPKA